MDKPAVAVAKLAFKGVRGGDRPDLTQLREAYPELDFIFDLIEDLEERLETCTNELEQKE